MQDHVSKLPIQFITQHNIGVKMADRMAYNSAGVTATVIPCTSLTLQAGICPHTHHRHSLRCRS